MERLSFSLFQFLKFASNVVFPTTYVETRLVCFPLISQIQPSYLNIKECNVNGEHQIRLRPTIPIRGGEIGVTFGTMDNGFLASSCKISITPGDEHKWQEISVQAVCDNTNRAFAPFSFTFSHINHRYTNPFLGSLRTSTCYGKLCFTFPITATVLDQNVLKLVNNSFS